MYQLSAQVFKAKYSLRALQALIEENASEWLYFEVVLFLNVKLPISYNFMVILKVLIILLNFLVVFEYFVHFFLNFFSTDE